MTNVIKSNIQMQQYLDIPAVSASLIRSILPPGCPRQAWWDSWLNPGRTRDESSAMDLGTLAHSILLEGGHAGLVIVDAEDWRTKAAKEERDAAREAGKLPVLRWQLDAAENMVDSARDFIESCKKSEPAIWAAFQPDGGKSEVTMLWDDIGVNCKLRADRLSNDHRLVVDAKFTATSPDPDAWGKSQLIRMGYYVSGAWYRRGIKAVTGIEADYVFLVISTEPPYLCSLVGMDPMAHDIGHRRVIVGLKAWANCLSTNRWPGYPTRVVYPELPAWEAARVEEEEANEGYQWSEELYKG